VSVYRFEVACVQANGDDITEMVDSAREITYRTFFQYASRADVEGLFPFYDRTARHGGLSIKKDWHVRYFKSRYRGRPCYYLVHSAIEYVFTRVRA
jgi:hypothetical protein